MDTDAARNGDVGPATRVGLDGATTPLGARIAAFVAADPAGAVAVALTGTGAAGAPTDLDALVLTAAGPGPDADGSTVGGTDLAAAHNLLGSVGAPGSALRTVVVVSSAMVYGARADTPVPLTEDAPVAPSAGARHADDRAALERLVADWRAGRPEVTVAVLRPTVCVAPERAPRWLERSAWHARSLRQVGRDRPAQYLHLDDLARAVEHARRHRLDGAFNVAPDGALSAREQLELVGAGRPPRTSAAVAAALTRLRWVVGLGTTPPDLAPYARWPWVVANDRLRATGWSPEFSNEEAFVVGHRPGWWSTLTPDQRQLVALGGSLVGAAGVVAAVVAALVPRRGRRRGAGARGERPGRRFRGAAGRRR